MEFFFQLLLNGLAIGFIYAIAALGFVMIYKSSSVLNFAHGELLAIGAFIFLILVTSTLGFLTLIVRLLQKLSMRILIIPKGFMQVNNLLLWTVLGILL